MKKREPVSHIMSKNLYKVNLSNTLREVNSLFQNHPIRHIPVVSGEKLVGIISKTDLLRVSYGGNFGVDQQSGVDEAIFDMFTIAQLMAKEPKTVGPDTTIHNAAEILTENEFHALPVTDSNGNLEGIITTTDVIKYLLDQY